MCRHLYLACFAWTVAAGGKADGTRCSSSLECQSNSCQYVSPDSSTAVCCHKNLGVSGIWWAHYYCWGVAPLGAKCFDDRNCISGKCKDERCAGHCKTSAWKPWSLCDKECGNGTQSRQRTVVQEPKYGGDLCGKLEEKRHCNVDPCPIHCETSAWKPWSLCDRECGNGTQSRQRNVTQQPLHGGSSCGELEEKKHCNVHPCPIDCQLSDWAILMPCSKTCGNGTQSRQRTVTQQPLHGGVECGELEETQECNVDPCPSVEEHLRVVFRKAAQRQKRDQGCQSVSISELTFSGNGINLVSTDDSGAGNWADVYCEVWVGEDRVIKTSFISKSHPSWSNLGTVHNNGSDIFILCVDSDVNLDDFVGFTSFTPQFSNVDAPHVATDFGWKQPFNVLPPHITRGKTSHGGMTYQGVTLTCRYQCGEKMPEYINNPVGRRR